MDFLANNSMLMMERSLDFLWTKQAAILDNISNVETPDYKAKYVTFEEALQAQLEGASARVKPRQAIRDALEKAAPQVHEAQESLRADGNGVNITEQSVELSRNGYQMEYVMASINADIAVLRTAIKGQ